jgi:hypothetical protein
MTLEQIDMGLKLLVVLATINLVVSITHLAWHAGRGEQ